MAKHPTYVPSYKGTLEELAKAIENMSYDGASSFTKHYADKFKERADKDLKDGKPKLAEKLYKVADYLYKAKEEIDKAWKICETHTTKIYRK